MSIDGLNSSLGAYGQGRLLNYRKFKPLILATSARQGRSFAVKFICEVVSLAAAALLSFFFCEFITSAISLTHLKADAVPLSVVGVFVLAILFSTLRAEDAAAKKTAMDVGAPSWIWLLVGVALFIVLSTNYARQAFVFSLAVGIFGLALSRGIAVLFHCRRLFGRRRVLLLASQTGDEGAVLGGLAGAGANVVHRVELTNDETKGGEQLTALVKDWAELSARLKVNEIIVWLRRDHAARLESLLWGLRFSSARVRLALELPDNSPRGEDKGPQLALGTVKWEPIGRPGAAIKRAIDVTASATALFLLLPVLCLIAVGIRLDSRGPLLFRQKRTGLNGRQFEILKFRTMKVMEDGHVIRQAQKNDDRVTRFGRFLRSSSLDELPQLINILRGEMSLVGPRPHALAHDRQYGERIANYVIRQQVKPGLTGWAQANGSRGPTPLLEDMERRVRLDIWYVRNWSVLLDLRILLMTVAALWKKGVAF